MVALGRERLRAILATSSAAAAPAPELDRSPATRRRRQQPPSARTDVDLELVGIVQPLQRRRLGVAAGGELSRDPDQHRRTRLPGQRDLLAPPRALLVDRTLPRGIAKQS